jgi:hypothetical protein
MGLRAGFGDWGLCTGICGDSWDCQIIDWDWPGREGAVAYPLGVYDRPPCGSDLSRRPDYHLRADCRNFWVGTLLKSVSNVYAVLWKSCIHRT